VVTHEVGHYMRIAHPNVRGSIMAPRSCQDGEAWGTAQLSDDDIAAVCLIYPPKGTSDELAPLPKPAQGCATTPAPAQEAPLLPFGGLVGLGLVIALRRVHFRHHRTSA